MRFTPLLALLPALARAQMSSTTTASAALATPGFVNNGTIGSVQCSGSSNTTVAEGQAVLNATAAPSYAAPSYATCPDALQPSYPFNKIHLRAPDDSLRATFIPFGATLTELWTKARDGSWRDVVLSFDNVTNYATDPIHPNFGPTVGRYANRIKNGTFEIDGVVSGIREIALILSSMLTQSLVLIDIQYAAQRKQREHTARRRRWLRSIQLQHQFAQRFQRYLFSL